MTLIFPTLSPQEQAQAVIDTETKQHDHKHKAGEVVYLISGKWFDEWCKYTGCKYDAAQKKLVVSSTTGDDHEAIRPGPIDSSDLLDTSAALQDLTSEEFSSANILKPGLIEKKDFWILHESTYGLLKSWYGATGPEITRSYLAAGPSGSRIEVHHDQWHIKAIDEHSSKSTIVPAVRTYTVLQLKEACCQALDVEVDEVEMASYSGQTNPQSLEEKHHKTLGGALLQDRQAVLIRRKDHPEVAAAAAAKRMALMQNPTSTMPLATPGTATAAIPMSVDPTAAAASPPAPPPVLTLTTPLSPTGGSAFSPTFKISSSPLASTSPLSRSFGKPPTWAEDAIVPSHRRPGLAGLGNLGNTCFMNSSLQCLVHTMPLMRTFLTGSYRGDLNRDNPLGLGGKLAAAFGGLMSKLWRGGVSHVSPKHFKWQLGKFAPQFGGYAQQDSQELLAFLLDGLHEDLNRIAVKPYREEKDADGRPDAEVAAEAWENYRARNDSVIVDHFQGLYKSSLRCPMCGRCSVKFDPFMYLSLPLPTPKTRTLTIVAIDASGSAAPLQVSVEVLKTGTIGDVLQKVAACCEGQPSTGSSEEQETDVLQRWMLMQWNPTHFKDKLKLYNDPKQAVSCIEEPRGSGRYSYQKPGLLVAYRYPTAATGPGSGLRPTVIFHKVKHSITGAPTLLYVASEATAPKAEDAEDSEAISGPLFTKGYSKWELATPNPIVEPLAAFLQPFVKPGEDLTTALPQNAPAAAAAAAEEATPMQESSAATNTVVGMSRPESQDGMEVDAAAAPEAGESAAPAAATAADVSLDDGSMPDLDPFLNTETEPEPDSAPAEDGINAAKLPSTAAAAADGMAVDSVNPIAPATTPAAPITATNGPTVITSTASTLKKSPPAPAVSIALSQASSSICSVGFLSKDTPGALMGDITYLEPLYLTANWSDEAAGLLDLSPWDTPMQHQSALDAEAAARAPAKPVTLDDCVDAFLQPEKLDAEDSWYCSGCKSHVQAEKKLDLWSLPEVLVVHLKRFSYSRYSRDKLDTEVDFPLEGLDLRKVVPVEEGGTRGLDDAASAAHAAVENGKAAPIYDLYAVSNHYGGLGGGHYTAYCRMPDDGKWYSYDDSHVTDMDAHGVKTPAAYVLFYRRRCAQDSDVEQVIAAAVEAAENPDGASVLDVDAMTGGFGPASYPGRRLSGPMLEQVNEEGETENGVDGENIPPLIGAAPLLEGDEEEQVAEVRPGESLAAHAVAFDDDIDMEI